MTYRKILLLACILPAFCMARADKTILCGHEILPHPRLFFTANDEARIKRLTPRTPLLQQMRRTLLKQADKWVAAPVRPYGADPVTKNMLDAARNETRTIIDLALAYRLTGDSRYSRKAEAELRAVCSYPDWFPQHFLDPAEYTMAVSIGYDWLYHSLSADTRNLIEQALVTHSLRYATEAYSGATKTNWADARSNWNTGCNGAMLIGAMAIAETDTAMAASIVRNAVARLPLAMESFAPDGASYEGSFYWGYAGIYFCMVADALQKNLGTDFGLMKKHGLSRSIESYKKIISPAGNVFSYADGGERTPFQEPVYFYYSRHFGDAEAAQIYRGIIKRTINSDETPINYFYLCIPWFDNAKPKRPPRQQRVAVVGGRVPLGVLQGCDAKGRNIWLAAKGGVTLGGHQQMDLGTFELECDSVVWLCDMGREQSSVPGYWDTKRQRWQYLREGARGHNVMMLNSLMQDPKATATIVAEDTETDTPQLRIDLTAAYPAAKSAVCTFRLVDDGTIEMTDELCLQAPWQKVEWNAMTRADIEAKGQKAVLRSGGKTLYATILEPADAAFTWQEARARFAVETPPDGYRHLQVALVAGTGTSRLRIRFSNSPD